MTIDDIKKHIENGKKTYLNKTRLYLAPCMELYGEDVMQTINNLNYFWCGIDPKKEPYHIYYIYHWYTGMKGFGLKVKERKSLKDYLTLDIMPIPKSMHRAYDKFITGKYSQMYVRHDLEKIFINPDPRFGNIRVKELASPVLTKHPKRREVFEKTINSWAKDNYDDTWINLPEEAELDTMWKQEHEVLNI